MKFCTNCGKANAPTAKFCGGCGMSLENDQNVESIAPSDAVADALPNPATVSRFSNLEATFLHAGRLRSSIRNRFLAIAVFVCAIFGLGLMPISKTTASPFMKNMVPIPGRDFMMGRTEVTQAQW
ncbi:MAG: zinc-ribbon domain-containing protein, partial [Kiritimatiellia bacterium]